MRFRNFYENGTTTADVACFARPIAPIRRPIKPRKDKEEKPVNEVSGPHSYSCVMAMIDEKPAKKIMDWCKKNIKEKDLADHGREDEPHVTILYGLHTNDVKEVQKVLKNTKGGSFKLGKVTKFDNPEYDVIKLSVTGSALHKLNSLCKKLEHTSSYPNYTPHCTIAYVKKGTCDHLLGKEIFADEKCELDEIQFSSASGVKTFFKLT